MSSLVATMSKAKNSNDTLLSSAGNIGTSKINSLKCIQQPPVMKFVSLLFSTRQQSIVASYPMNSPASTAEYRHGKRTQT